VDSVETCLRGDSLYGDDFTPDQIVEWYADEQEAYSALGAKDSSAYRYGYHAWNTFHAFRHLPSAGSIRVLAFGGAYGDELLPIISRLSAITVVDSSSAFSSDHVQGVPAAYVRPTPDGMLALPDESFDLVTCIGTLHHIPNVSLVVGELARVLRTGGHMILREPIVSMGDWRVPRRGLTKRERGIPLPILLRIVRTCGLEVDRVSLCGFPITQRLFRLVRPDVYNSVLATWTDAALSALFSWNTNYHPRGAVQRLRPTSVFLVLKKPEPIHTNERALG
jgi:SAM-dependent methyltransferase